MTTREPNADQQHEDIVINPSEVGRELSEDDTIYLRKFQFAWQEFLRQNPALVPRGKKAARINTLKNKLKAKANSKREAENELRRQHDFFMDSREALEETYATEIVFAKNLQNVIYERLQRQHAEVELSKQITNRLNTWDHFIEKLDVSSTQFSFPKSEENLIKPTARALALVDPGGDEEDTMLRGLRMDHALMKTETKLLYQELESIELSNLNLEFIGKFLTEFNIWGVLMKQHTTEQSAKAIAKAKKEAAKINAATKALGTKNESSRVELAVKKPEAHDITTEVALKFDEPNLHGIHQQLLSQQNDDKEGRIAFGMYEGVEEEKIGA
eukprot:CAMPEP_0194218166 /NCGR_PEP_ID=MMETSP0156-20130528/23147_1 /TAXON_ID=33649 /ORGANISM="Thalassionema nitzschioides, Strain L26-B" /LENGTH=328 /DNA_ID=CAMNT_0038947423 /DNA_START=10 /DNA_END=996 /DNA_ORIENTATION=-